MLLPMFDFKRFKSSLPFWASTLLEKSSLINMCLQFPDSSSYINGKTKSNCALRDVRPNHATVLLLPHIFIWYTARIASKHTYNIIDSCIVDVVINWAISMVRPACALYLMHASIVIEILIECHRLHTNWIKRNDYETALRQGLLRWYFWNSLKPTAHCTTY